MLEADDKVTEQPNRRSSRGTSRNGAKSNPREAVGVHVRIASCYNLLMREARKRVSNRWNLTLPQFDVLAELARADRRGFTFVELSRLLLVTSGNLTGIVDRLEARQLVRREPSAKDRRVVRVKLTERGRAMNRQMLPRHSDDLSLVLSFMSKGALRRLIGLLDEVRHGLEASADAHRVSEDSEAPRAGARRRSAVHANSSGVSQYPPVGLPAGRGRR
jgi:DNA-binding MarR family transcriptional regulator